MTGVGFSPNFTPVCAVSPSYREMRSDTSFARALARPSRSSALVNFASAVGFPFLDKIARFR